MLRPGTPDPGTPDPGTPDPGTPDPGTAHPSAPDTWATLRSALPMIYPLAPPHPQLQHLESHKIQPPETPSVCLTCRGPLSPGFVRCYQCARHARLAPGLLADAMVPISYAVKGTALATALWQYKSWRQPNVPARAALLALLLAFLHDHGACVWRHAGMPAAGGLAVVPTGCGRPGPHPLLELTSYLRLPLIWLAICPGTQGRDLDVNRFRAGPVAAGADLLLIDDSWVSGASAQSAVAALKLAGARRVAVVVLGRHLDPADPQARRLAPRLRPARYDPLQCAVHPAASPWFGEPFRKPHRERSG